MIARSSLLGRAFVRGMAQAVDLTGSIGSRRLRRMVVRSDRAALLADWAAVSRDLRVAVQRYAAGHGS
ncbi:hypothetical protein [Longimicrobium sp.]|uniref:hypothetical protein n=1 Tax=Longimicrobium sp. TaxID=2029185 RepID=UPI002CD81802|nr:hypothetical protein [Longimicrobium sp.]HSU13374.1 hypothetical protein [Longimicrobium sp.]